MPKFGNSGLYLKNESLKKIPDFPNFEIFGRFGSFCNLRLFGLVLARFVWFRLVLAGFGPLWLVSGFRKYACVPIYLFI